MNNKTSTNDNAQSECLCIHSLIVIPVYFYNVNNINQENRLKNLFNPHENTN